MEQTLHAKVRSQQRGIPPIVVDLVRLHGAHNYDHRGGVVRYLNKRARRSIEKELGSQVMRRLSEFMNVYVVESAVGRAVVTVGHRYKRISRG